MSEHKHEVNGQTMTHNHKVEYSGSHQHIVRYADANDDEKKKDKEMDYESMTDEEKMRMEEEEKKKKDEEEKTIASEPRQRMENLLASVRTRAGVNESAQPNAEVEALKKEFAEEKESNQLLRRKLRLQELSETLKPLTTIPGTVEENASKLLKFEESSQPEMAAELLTSWQEMEKNNKLAGMFGVKLSPQGGVAEASSPIEKEMNDWADANEKSFAEATVHYRENLPNKWKEYRISQREVV